MRVENVDLEVIWITESKFVMIQYKKNVTKSRKVDCSTHVSLYPLHQNKGDSSSKTKTKPIRQP